MKLTFTMLLTACALYAQQPTVLTSGLLNPQKLILTPQGNLLVSETGKDPNTGRVSLIDRKSGARRTIVDGLPSGPSNPENIPIGPTGMLLRERTLLITIGEGDAVRAGTRAGSFVLNPAGESSPIFSSVIRIRFNRDIDQLAGGNLSLKPADHLTMADGDEVKLNGGGDEAVADVLTNFADVTPDPNTIYRHSDPYGLAIHPRFPDTVFVLDAGQNSIRSVNLESGRTRTLMRFPPVRNTTPVGPPVSDAVPDSIRVYGNQFLVTMLTGFPFVPGASSVVTVDPATGEMKPFITGLSSAIDSDRRGNTFFVLQYSTAMLATPPGPGALLRYDSPTGQVVTTALTSPTSMLVDGSDIFISELGGTIKHLTVQ